MLDLFREAMIKPFAYPGIPSEVKAQVNFAAFAAQLNRLRKNSQSSPVLYQGTTLVVPKVATSDSGFSRCVIANN
jgi:hypothetical protein